MPIEPCHQKRIVAGRQGFFERCLNVDPGGRFAHSLTQIGHHVPCGTIFEEKNLPLSCKNPVEGGLVVVRERSSPIRSRGSLPRSIHFLLFVHEPRRTNGSYFHLVRKIAVVLVKLLAWRVG